jgi:hypothetical protein
LRARDHPALRETERKFDAVNRLSSLYGELSAGIHGRTVSDLEMRRSLSKIVYADAAAIREAEFVRRCAESVNFLLSVFHVARMRSFQIEDRRIILRTLPRSARTILAELE